MARLNGTELLGHIYDLHGRYANSKSVRLDLPLFNLPDTPETGVTLYGKGYSCPDIISVDDSVMENYYEINETYTTQNLLSQFKVSLNVKAGISSLFGAELGTRYEQKSITNTHFFHVTQKGRVHSYRISLPHISELKRYLKPQVKIAINNPNLHPRELIRSYGTHFLFSAIFGGEWSFTRSVSSFEYQSEMIAGDYIRGSYLKIIEAGADTEIRDIESRSVSETNAKWLANGGRLSVLPNFGAWASSVEDGNFAFVDFDNSTSLQPISVLADDAVRQTAIQNEIEREIQDGVGVLRALKWHDPQVIEHGSGGVDLEVCLSNPHRVIIGFGATVHGDRGKVTHLAAKYLDLLTNETGWIYDPRSKVSGFNRGDYEMIYPVAGEDDMIKGTVLTLLRLLAEGGSLHEMEMLFNKIDPADLEGNRDYISENECVPIYRHSTYPVEHPSRLGVQRQSGWDRQYDSGGKKVIVGIGLSYHSDGSLPKLRVTEATLGLEDLS